MQNGNRKAAGGAPGPGLPCGLVRRCRAGLVLVGLLGFLDLYFGVSAVEAECPAHRIKAERSAGKDETITQWGTCVSVNLKEFGRKGSGWILTAAHVVDKGKPFVEIGGEWKACQIVHSDKEADLALLQTIEKADQVGVEVAEAPTYQIFASPRAECVGEQRGTVTRESIACTMSQGMSGGAIVDSNGRLAGILLNCVVSKDGKTDREGTFVSAGCIREFLKK